MCTYHSTAGYNIIQLRLSEHVSLDQQSPAVAEVSNNIISGSFNLNNFIFSLLISTEHTNLFFQFSVQCLCHFPTGLSKSHLLLQACYFIQHYDIARNKTSLIWDSLVVHDKSLTIHLPTLSLKYVLTYTYVWSWTEAFSYHS